MTNIKEQAKQEKGKKAVKEKITTHVSAAKKRMVKELGVLMNKKTVMLVSVKSLPCSQFQEIRKKLRGKADMKVAKKSSINLALEAAKNPALHELEKHVQENMALLFSDDDAFEISAFLSESKSPSKARVGQIADEDITIEAGPTELLPGPAITELSSAGLKVKVENGKIAIQNNTVFVKKGEKVTEQKAGILSKLGVTPFKVGLEPVTAFYEGKVYTDIKVNKEESLNELKEKFGRCLAFAVSLNYPTSQTVPFILGKAAMQEKAIAALIKPESNSN